MDIKTIMTKEVISCHPETTVAEIARLLFDHNLTGMPVVDYHNKVVGIVTEYDLMSKHMGVHIPTYMKLLESLGRNEVGTRIRDELEAILRTTAKEIMTDKAVTVRPESIVENAALIFSEQRINPLPVVDKSGQLVGIVSRADIVKLFKKK
ncbi:MAG: CBS domain-containing protein [Patescibacteria group bacterium]